MATQLITFTTTEGGVNGSNAIVDNSAEFYVDLGKSTSFETLTISEPAIQLGDYGNVLGIEVIIEDSFGNLGGGTDVNTFDTSLYHASTAAYTDAITTDVESDDPITRTMGGPTNTWGKTWSTNDINTLIVKLNNPTEPNGGNSIALRGTFVYARITYNIPPPHLPTLSIETGRINLQQGNITIS